MNGPAFSTSHAKRVSQRLRRAGLACIVACAAVTAALPARAADDDKSFDEKIIDSILKGAGLRDDSANIEYRERSPLVIPPEAAEATLPPPDTSASVNNPNWPVDPEIKRARAAKKTVNNNYLTGDSLLDDGRPLRPDEMMRGRKTTGGGVTASNQIPSDYSEKMTPNQLGSRGGLFNNLFAPSEEVAPFTGEPPRTTLIEPPRGYQTPSPAQPYGVGKAAKGTYGPVQDNYTTRVEAER
ncbi:MAG: hypothetical protein AB7T86_01220 [Xanthobacteraceae bacterium]|jgi:hypothetical protein|uniref:hypothetical protein n=1 Tax=Pseudolabrys sp. TaxID=1960880 RepID=UPI003D0E39BA